jgi:hypothetical protein
LQVRERELISAPNRHLERSNLRRSFYDVQHNVHYFLFQAFLV